MPIAVTDRITRGTNNTSPFAVAWEEDLKTSFVTVGSETDRDAIPEWKRIPYMTVKCTGSNKRYVLGADVTIAGQVWTEETFLTDLEGVVYEGDIFNSEGYIKSELIRNVYLNDSFVVDSQAEMLALTTVTGNFVIRTDTGDIYVKLNNDNPSDIGDFSVITHSASVISVNGMTGIVEITLAGMLAISANLTTFNTAVTNNATVANHTTAITNLTARVDALEDALAGIGGGGSIITTKANVTLANGVTTLDWSVADIQVLTISEAKVINNITNPVLGATLEIILAGTFSLTFSGISAFVEGTYNPGETNRVFIYCDSVTSPNYLIQYYNTLGSSELSDGNKGDITVASGGAAWSVNNNAITYAKMQNVSATNRLLGRVSSGSGDPEEVTPTQVTAMLDNFTSTLDGLAPASGGGTTNFLRADGTWAAAGVSLSNGNGTTFNTDQVDLGGTLTGDVEIDGAQSFYFGKNVHLSFFNVRADDVWVGTGSDPVGSFKVYADEFSMVGGGFFYTGDDGASYTVALNGGVVGFAATDLANTTTSAIEIGEDVSNFDAVYATKSTAALNTSPYGFILRRQVYGESTAADNLGIGLGFEIRNDSLNFADVVGLKYVLTDVSDATEDGIYTWTLHSAGVVTTMLTMDATGQSYNADLSAANAANPRWIPDKAYVDSVAGGGGGPVTLVDGSGLTWDTDHYNLGGTTTADAFIVLGTGNQFRVDGSTTSFYVDDASNGAGLDAPDIFISSSQTMTLASSGTALYFQITEFPDIIITNSPYGSTLDGSYIRLNEGDITLEVFDTATGKLEYTSGDSSTTHRHRVSTSGAWMEGLDDGLGSFAKAKATGSEFRVDVYDGVDLTHNLRVHATGISLATSFDSAAYGLELEAGLAHLTSAGSTTVTSGGAVFLQAIDGLVVEAGDPLDTLLTVYIDPFAGLSFIPNAEPDPSVTITPVGEAFFGGMVTAGSGLVTEGILVVGDTSGVDNSLNFNPDGTAWEMNISTGAEFRIMDAAGVSDTRFLFGVDAFETDVASVKFTGIANDTTTDVLFYDSVTGEITYGAAPTGSGTPKLVFTKSFENPVAGDKFILAVGDMAMTPTKVFAFVKGTGTPSVTWNITYASTADSGAPTKFWTTDKTTTSTSGVSFTSFDNSSPGANNYIQLTITSISGTAVTEIAVGVVMTY